MAPSGQVMKRFSIVGQILIPGASDTIKRLQPQVELELLRVRPGMKLGGVIVPDDPNSVAVAYQKRHIGYLPRGLAAEIAPLMDAGVKVIARKAPDALEGVCQIAYIAPPITGTMHLVDKGDLLRPRESHEVLPPDHPANTGHAAEVPK
jgi:hypothetical protein